MTTVSNDLLGADVTSPVHRWSFREQTHVAAGFWDDVAHELDGALIRTFGPGRWETYLEQIFETQQRTYFPHGCNVLGIDPHAPDAVKCAQYHCLSTALAGSRSRYCVESPTRAWVFYLPNLMSAGSPTYRNVLQLAAYRGWYSRNGSALGNERMIFVVTHLVENGDPYDAGYFEDTGTNVSENERLRFDLGANPPPPAQRQPASFDGAAWPEERRLKAFRNLRYGWAWDHVAAAGLHLGEDALAPICSAFTAVISSYLPLFQHGIDASGPAMWTSYFASVHEFAGAPVTVKSSGSWEVRLDRDPLTASSFAVPPDVAARIAGAIQQAWHTSSAEQQVSVALAPDGAVVFGHAANQ